MNKQISIGFEHSSNITTILEELTKVRDLEYLTIWAGGMTSLPEILSMLNQVRILHVLCGNFGSIPSPILKMTSLQVLSLRENKINCIAGVSNLKSLEFLDVGENEISSINEEIGALENLRKLYLSDNSIIEISSSLYKLKKLEYLSIDRINFNELNLKFLPESIIIDICDPEVVIA
jgi:Leucine-rich repeat (LRR) protein